MQAIPVTLGCFPKLDDLTLLLKIPYTLNTGLGVELELTWNLSLRGLVHTVFEVIRFSKGETSQ